MAPLQLRLVGDREVVMLRRFQARREQVWAAHTRPDQVQRWLLGPPGWTMPVCEIDLRAGGRYRYVWRHSSGSEMGLTGRYRSVDAPSLLASTELFDADWTGGETELTQRFSEAVGVTTLETTLRYASALAREAALATRMAEGIEMSFVQLDAWVAAPT